MDDIRIEKINSTILITLTREKVLNALNLKMVREIYKHIDNWDKDEQISGVIIKGAGEKSFCAGGDIVSVYHSREDSENNISDSFFREEYILNYAISEFSKPWISVLNGIAMGGGLGLSVHGSYRIVNDMSITAMPETAIGLFPDVGGGYFLSRMGPVGLYLALTGKVMNGVDSMQVGIGTHYIQNNKLDSILKELTDQNKYSKSFVDNLFSKHCEKVFDKESVLKKELKYINKHFDNSQLVDIYNSLKSDNSEWALNTLKVFSKKSPTSMSVTTRQLANAKTLNLKECLKMEFRICQAMMAKNDFYEGVRANLVEKDRNPIWKPNDILNVDEKLIQEHFRDLGDKELFLNE